MESLLWYFPFISYSRQTLYPFIFCSIKYIYNYFRTSSFIILPILVHLLTDPKNFIYANLIFLRSFFFINHASLPCKDVQNISVL
jgi:hypothetical protein